MSTVDPTTPEPASVSPVPFARAPQTEQEKRRSFETQMLPHLDALYRTAYSMTKNAGDADDLVQDAYLRAFQFFDQFQGGTNSRAWLFRIMTNLYINTYRKKMREPERVSYDEMEDFFLYNRLASGPPGTAGGSETPETEVVQRVQIEAIREAIGQLPEEYRSTLVLADLNEFSYQEISDMLQIPLGTVRSRLSRGRRLVQKALWAYSENNQR